MFLFQFLFQAAASEEAQFVKIGFIFDIIQNLFIVPFQKDEFHEL